MGKGSFLRAGGGGRRIRLPCAAFLQGRLRPPGRKRPARRAGGAFAGGTVLPDGCRAYLRRNAGTSSLFLGFSL